jgi:cold shock CspA family protein
MFGFISFWKGEKGWGWVHDYSGKNKFFAHISAFKNGIAPEVSDGVRFDVNTTPRGPAAINIEIVETKVEVGGVQS